MVQIHSPDQLFFPFSNLGGYQSFTLEPDATSMREIALLQFYLLRTQPGCLEGHGCAFHSQSRALMEEGLRRTLPM